MRKNPPDKRNGKLKFPLAFLLEKEVKFGQNKIAIIRKEEL